MFIGWLGVRVALDVRDKAAYAALQGIEFDNRDRVLSTPILLRDQGDAGKVLGVRIEDARFPYCWLSITKLSANGEVLVLDGCDHVMDSCSSIDRVVAGQSAAPSIRKYIHVRCKRP